MASIVAMRASRLARGAERNRCELPVTARGGDRVDPSDPGDSHVGRAVGDLRREQPRSEKLRSPPRAGERGGPAFDRSAAQRELRWLGVRVGRGGHARALADVQQQLSGPVAPLRRGQDPDREPRARELRLVSIEKDEQRGTAPGAPLGGGGGGGGGACQSRREQQAGDGPPAGSDQPSAPSFAPAPTGTGGTISPPCATPLVAGSDSVCSVPSMFTRGMIRSSQAGSRQVTSPSR